MIRLLPILAATLPFAAVHVAYWLGIESGRLPACIPYIDGCTSISATGRHPPGSYVFKGIQIPFAVLLVWIWYVSRHWLVSLGCSRYSPTLRVLPVAGTIGALALIVYTTFLGSSGDTYEFMRRFGIYFYFFGTWGAQLAVSVALQGRAVEHGNRPLLKLSRSMLAITAAPLVLGLLNFSLKAVLADADQSENRIEWIAALAMQAWFLVLYAAWERTNFRARRSGSGS